MSDAAPNFLAVFAVFGLLPFAAAIFFGCNFGARIADGRPRALAMLWLVGLVVLSILFLLPFSYGIISGIVVAYGDGASGLLVDPGPGMRVLGALLIGVSAAAVAIGYKRARRVI